MTKIYNKLVRDKIPEIIKNEGKKPTIRNLSKIEYREALFEKIIEEVDEVFVAQNNKQNLIKEISDVYEVVDAIIEELNISKDDVQK